MLFALRRVRNCFLPRRPLLRLPAHVTPGMFRSSLQNCATACSISTTQGVSAREMALSKAIAVTKELYGD